MGRVSEREIERALTALRPLSDSARELVRLAADDDHRTGDVIAVIARDAALTLRVVELANSAAFAPRSPVESVERAVHLMGERAVVAAALAIGADWIHTPLTGYGAESRIFEDGIRTATLASLIAKRTPLADLSSTAYTAGLLRDLGKILSSGFLATRRASALEALKAKGGGDWLEVEQSVLGVDHCVLGARVAARFKLPASLSAVIEFHHAPSRAEPTHRPLVAIVHLADAALAMLGGAESIDALGYRFDGSVVGLLGLDEESFEAVLVESHAEASELLESVGRPRTGKEAA